MRNLSLCMVVAYFVVLVPDAVAQSEKSLVFYLYARSGAYEGAGYDYRDVMSFYPDGLIRSAQVTWFQRDTRAPHTGTRYRVIRDGNVIRKESTDEYGTIVSDIYTLGADSIVINTVRTNSGDTIVKSQRNPASSGATVYERLHSGVALYQYTFTPERVTIRQFPIRRTLTCSMDRKTGLPLMTSTYERTIGSDIRFGRTESGDIFAIFRDADGPLLASYRFEGTPMHASPLITVLNCEIGLDWLHGVLLPFIGGTPAE